MDVQKSREDFSRREVGEYQTGGVCPRIIRER